MAVDLMEKEVERLTSRFNAVFGEKAYCDLQSRYKVILAICEAGIVARSIRETSDEKAVAEMTRRFCQIREVINRYFDFLESHREGRKEVLTRGKQINRKYHNQQNEPPCEAHLLYRR